MANRLTWAVSMVLLGAGAGLAQQVPPGGTQGGPPSGAQEPAIQDPAIVAHVGRAKIAEIRGDVAAAESELRAALGKATGREQALVRRELLALLRRAGRTIAMDELMPAGTEPGAAATERPADPLAELVAMLDRDLMSETVDIARQELAKLGPLAVPGLLAALPKFGPFGLSNAFAVLQLVDDPRIGPAMLQLTTSADPSVAATMAEHLHEWKRSVALPLAQQFGKEDQASAVQLGALRALLKYAAEAPATRELALRLAADSTGAAQGQLLVFIEKLPQPWVDEALQLAFTHGMEDAKLEALRISIVRNQAMTAAEALRLTEGLPPKSVLRLAQQLVHHHPDWVQFGVAASRASRAVGDEYCDWGNLASSWEWWRDPAAGGVELLSMPCTSSEHAVRIQGALGELVERGWQVPQAFDAHWTKLLIAHSNLEFWKVFVKGLPTAAEDRALAICATMPRGYAQGFAQAAQQAERPWHRLYARQLASAETADQVTSNLVNRDWTGAPPDAIAALEGLAKRWPRSDAGGSLPWHSALVAVYRRTPGLPAAVVLPLAEAGNSDAFAALAAREPLQALACASAMGEWSPWLCTQLPEVLSDHGGAGQVDLFVRMLEEFDWALLQQKVGPLSTFVSRHASGNLDLLRLATSTQPKWRDARRRGIAMRTLAGARVADLEALLTFLPQLEGEEPDLLAQALRPQLRAEHAPLLAAAVDRLLPAATTAASDPGQQVAWLFGLLERVPAPDVLPVCRRVMDTLALPVTLRTQAAKLALASAGDQQPALLLAMLGTDNQAEVQVALVADVGRSDAAVQAARRAAILRLAAVLQDTEAVLQAFDAATRQQIAEALLAAPRYAEVQSDLASWAVGTIGRRKDPACIPQLAAAAHHPSYVVRAAAAKALGNTFAREAAPHLLDLLKDDRDQVRAESQKALTELANYLDTRAKWEARLK